MRKSVSESLAYIRSVTDFVPMVAIVLGSGLGGFTKNLNNIVCEIPYEDIPGFPVSTVSGHDGKFIMGYVDDVPVICMSGRVHYYEGYTPEEVVLPTRIMRAMGAEYLILSNAAGGINGAFTPGTLVLIRDHITLFVPNPLRGANDPDEGVRFPDMTEVYDASLRLRIHQAAEQKGFYLQYGVYCQLPGPSYETPSEIQLLGRLGADLVGMSTAMEALTAHHMGMKVCGISFVSNMAAGINPAPLDHDDVKLTGTLFGPRFAELIRIVVGVIKDHRTN